MNNTSILPHILDNMIWNAIITGNRDIARVDGEVGYYDPNIAPFAAASEWNNINLKKLYEFIPAGTPVAISYEKEIKLDERKWKTLQHMDCVQMVYEKPVTSFVTEVSSLIVPLDAQFIPQMLELTTLTKPGPFSKKTILFGNYFGIFIEGQLAAMTGQRMNPIPYMEVSAVCTHPEHRGHGYAKALMLHVMKIILDNSLTPFLHVLTSNVNAIQLYESIGFRIRKKLFIDVVKIIGPESETQDSDRNSKSLV